MDILLGRFADREIAEMTDEELAIFEALMEVPEQDIFSWISEKVPPPEIYDTTLLRRIISFHAAGGAKHDLL